MHNYRQIIESRGTTQAWIGRQLGVSRAMINMFLSGKTNLAPEKLQKLHRLLGLDSLNIK